MRTVTIFCVQLVKNAYSYHILRTVSEKCVQQINESLPTKWEAVVTDFRYRMCSSFLKLS